MIPVVAQARQMAKRYSLRTSDANCRNRSCRYLGSSPAKSRSVSTSARIWLTLGFTIEPPGCGVSIVACTNAILNTVYTRQSFAFVAIVIDRQVGALAIGVELLAILFQALTKQIELGSTSDAVCIPECLFRIVAGWYRVPDNFLRPLTSLYLIERFMHFRDTVAELVSERQFRRSAH